ncbi:potassium-transporting ATPase KdpC subunit [Acrocarpospora phusangensis]|uniref:Potassium-transporting ATPase KdpC subunit n=1 Tax=Acrocarpospora phusangensis TaxID=1070424 RepID=A0A919QGJ9_9ACTN|nr:potassium-transporting ATPase subunit C [Acrocarpospora phusangensis]GIH27163.1 potassium-transporting ATPase KdpC subunit [Acrocarpospora phusangensis]
MAREHLAAVRAVVVLTVLAGLLYPLLVMGLGQLLFHDRAQGSLLRKDGEIVGSALIGQKFTDAAGTPIPRYFQSRPSEAGDGYDMLATTASNLGPEDIVDTPEKVSLLTRVCARSRAVGVLEGVSGARPYCTGEGVGAVLKLFPGRVVSVNEPCPKKPFIPKYRGMGVECARPGEDYTAGRTIPIRGAATAVVPADAVTASGSGLDPDISVAYARLQAPRIARERGLPLARVHTLIDRHTTGRALGFLGEPAVNVLRLNLALDQVR